MYNKSGIVTDQSTAQVPVAGAAVFVLDGNRELVLLVDAASNPLPNPLTTDTFGAYGYYSASAGQVIHEYWWGARKRYIENVVIGPLIAAVNPSPENAGKYIAYDANGNPTASSGTGADIGLRTDLAGDGGSSLVKAADGNTVQQNLDNLSSYLDDLAGANIVNEATTTRILTADDNGKIVACTSATAVTITVPSGLGASFYCSIAQIGAGQVTVSAGSGVTLSNADSQYATQARYVRLTLWAAAADDLVLEGRTA